jgi:hypothetical protein
MSTYNFNRVQNTTVSGTSVFSSLDGDDYRAIEFSAANSCPQAVNITGPNVITLKANDWTQSAISALAVNAMTGGTITLGADSANQAAGYINLFNLRDLNDQRLLRFSLVAGYTGSTVTLANTAATSTFVQVNQQDIGTAANSKTLFDGNNQAGPGIVCPGAKPGYERLVQVRPTPGNPSALSAGSQSVQFNILPFSV